MNAKQRLILPLLASISFVASSSAFPLPTNTVPEQLAGKIVDANGHALSQAELANFDYFVFYVSASSCGPCKAITKDLIKFYDETGRKKKQVAFVLIGRDFDQEQHQAYVKDGAFPFFTSFWKDLIPLRTQFRAFQYWRGSTPYLYMLKRDGSCVINQYDWQTDQEASPTDTLKKIEKTVEGLK